MVSIQRHLVQEYYEIVLSSYKWRLILLVVSCFATARASGIQSIDHERRFIVGLLSEISPVFLIVPKKFAFL